MKKVLALVIVVLLLTAMAAPMALAAGDVTVTVSISVNGELKVAAEKVTTSDATVEGAIRAAHEAFCPDGADGYASGIDSTWNMFMIQKVWGVTNTPYVILNSAPLGSGANAAYSFANETPIADGDNIIVIQDTTYMVPVIALTAEPDGSNIKLTATQWTLDFATFTYKPAAYVGEIQDADGAVLGTTDAEGVLVVPATAKAVVPGAAAVPADGSAVAAAPAEAPAAAVPASGDAITVYVSISADGVLKIASQPVQITTYTVEAALQAAHEAYCPQGAAGFSAGIDATYGMYMINTVWGVKTTPYVIKNSAPLGSGANSEYISADTTPVEAGDNIIVVADSMGLTPAVSLEYDAETQIVKVNQWALDFTTFKYTNAAVENVDVIDAKTGAVLGTTNALGNARLSKQPECGVVMYQGVSAVRTTDDVAPFDCLQDKYVAPAHDYSLFGGADGKSLRNILIVGLGLVIPLIIVVLYAQNKETKSGGIKYEDLRGDSEVTRNL